MTTKEEELIQKTRAQMRFRQKKAQMIDKEWYSARSLFGNTWAYFFILLGGRP